MHHGVLGGDSKRNCKRTYLIFPKSTLDVGRKTVRMARLLHVPPISHDIQHFLRDSGRQGPDYLTMVSQFVLAKRDKTCNLKSPDGAKWTVGDVTDTMYSDCNREVNGWGKFYLKDQVNMKVIGVVEGTSCPCDELVLMTCEDKKVYAYDGGELHLVATSLQELGERGIEYPASKTYYYGEAFKDMTDQDWDKVKKGPVGKSLDKAHRELVTAEISKSLAMKKT